MNISRVSFLACCGALAMSVPAMAGVVVNSPANDSTVTAPFTLSASASNCSGKSVSAMGYSFDSSSNTTVFKSQSIDTSVDVSAGTHTLHVKAWISGGVCVTDVKINVQAGASTASSTSSSSGSSSEIPSYAKSNSNIQALSDWQAHHDTGGSGSSSGSTYMVSSPSKYGSTRKYVNSFSSSGDERFSVQFTDDTSSHNFFYDGWVYFTSSASKLGNLELDVNQTMANGQTVLVGVQCDGYTGEWAYTVNTGSASSVRPKWYSKSGTSCNPRSWSQNTWHHVQFSFSRTDSGHITYHSVWLDGKEQVLNATAFGAADLHWGPVINTQFQLDGMGSGTVTAYLDNLTIYRW